jgi:hypothetical protein
MLPHRVLDPIVLDVASSSSLCPAFHSQVPEFKPAAASVFFEAFLAGKSYPAYNPKTEM